MNPYFDNIQAFLHMGGHGLYVWLSYGLTLTVVVLTVLVPYYQQRHFFAEQIQLQKRLKAASDKQPDQRNN